MYIKVIAVPESTEEEVKVVADDSFTVRVHEKPERGEANRRVRELLSAHFGRGKRVRLINGHSSSHKIFSID